MTWRPREHRGLGVTKTWREACVGRAIMAVPANRLCGYGTSAKARESQAVGVGIAHRSDLDSLGISNPSIDARQASQPTKETR